MSTYVDEKGVKRAASSRVRGPCGMALTPATVPPFYRPKEYPRSEEDIPAEHAQA